MNMTSHRVYQTGEGERGSERAANDLGLLRIGLWNCEVFLSQRFLIWLSFTAMTTLG